MAPWSLNLGEVRMIERREHLRLARKARDAIWIVRENIWKNLEGDLAIQPRIASPVDFAHPSGAESREHFVCAEPSPGDQCHAEDAIIVELPSATSASWGSSAAAFRVFGSAQSVSSVVPFDFSVSSAAG